MTGVDTTAGVETTPPRRARVIPRLALHYGRSAKPLAWIEPDAVYPGMWRLRHPDGELSDIANLTRIKDAAVITHGGGRLLHWRPSPQPRRGSPALNHCSPLSDGLGQIDAPASLRETRHDLH